MNAGGEMDALIAEKVMGIKIRRVSITSREGAETIDVGELTPKSGIYYWNDLPHYSTEIAAAWEVVDKLKNRGFRIWRKADGTGYFCELREHGSYAAGAPQGDAETAPHAICLAALKAVDGA